jgi:pimeloyl-ACP methyl ester carboxylesterase
LWPGLTRSHDGLTLDPSDPRRVPNVNVVDVVRDVSVLSHTETYYQPLLDGLAGGGYKELGSSKDLFIFPYDWRKSITENAPKLGDLVKQIRSLYPNSDVDIVAHSTGGLLARRYIIDNPGTHHVARLVTIGSPWLGAPKAINVMSTGDFVSRFVVQRSTIKRLAVYFPGVHELLPTKSYIALGGVPFSEDGWDVNQNGRADGNYNYEQLVGLLDFSFPGGHPGTNNRAFHDYPTQDDWHADASGVRYYHIYGVRSRKDTISCVTAWSRRGLLGPKFELHLHYDSGDGTVPRLSAQRPAANGLQLNAPGAVVQGFFASQIGVGDLSDDGVEHTGLTKNHSVQSAALCALSSDNPADCVTNVAAPLSQEAAEDSLSYYLSLSGVNGVAVTDQSGNTTRPLDDETDAGLPGVISNPTGPDSLGLVVPTSQTYSITFTAGAELIDVEIARGVSDVNPSEARRYHDLLFPAGTKLKLSISPQGTGALLYDRDGDGTFETIVSPASDVSGTAAQDVTPPTVSVSATRTADAVTVSLTAQDTGSGVKATYYSLDGVNFTTYTKPFNVDPSRGEVVYAFADDNVANRSGLVIYYPTATANPLDNPGFFVRQHYLDFLGRAADASGLQFWVGNFTECGANAQCVEVKRINVSAAFFLSIEFQETGYLAYRAQKAAFGNLSGKPVPITRQEMLDDVQVLASGLIVGADGWQQKLEQNKQTYFDRLAGSTRFTALYPQSMTPEAYVDALNANAGGALSQAERDSLVAELKNGTKTRAQVLRSVAEDPDLNTAEKNKAFVLMQYFGYLRRDPDSTPDSDFSGFNFWLGKLNQFNGNFIQAEMVKAFLDSIEYRNRFGQ